VFRKTKQKNIYILTILTNEKVSTQERIILYITKTRSSKKHKNPTLLFCALMIAIDIDNTQREKEKRREERRKTEERTKQSINQNTQTINEKSNHKGLRTGDRKVLRFNPCFERRIHTSHPKSL